MRPAWCASLLVHPLLAFLDGQGCPCLQAGLLKTPNLTWSIQRHVTSPDRANLLAHCVHIHAQAEVRQDLVTATAASSIIACFIMGAGANMPLALAPG